MQESTTLSKAWVTIKGEVIAGGPVRKIYSDRDGNWLKCTDREKAVLKKFGYTIPGKPFADIILIKYGQPELENQCIESIKKHTNLNRHILTDVDNKFIDKNLGALWNDLISASDAPYVCLLNTDTIVEDDWLDKLVEAAETTGADAVGPITNKCGIAYQVGNKIGGEKLKEVTQLSGFCVLIRKESWKRVGGFPEFFPFYGQESDLMDRLSKKIVCKNVFIQHLGGGTIKNTKGRSQETEKKLSLEVYKRVRQFDWKHKLLILGSAPGNHFPLWRGVDQTCDEFNRRGGEARQIPVEQIQDEETFSEIVEWKPDTVITICTNPTRLISSVPNIKRLPGLRGLWHNDLRAVNSEYGSMYKVFHALFMCWEKTSGEYDLEALGQAFNAPVFYMPQGSVINPCLSRAEEKYRALFIGGTGNDKYHIGRNGFFKAINATVFNESNRTKRIRIEDQSARLYRSARYSIAHSPDVPGYNSLRLYNILAYGGCALVRHFDGIDKLFKDHEHLFIFRDAKQANELMVELDGNPVYREQVARNGWRLQQAKHTVLWRIMNIISNLREDKTFWGWA